MTDGPIGINIEGGKPPTKGQIRVASGLSVAITRLADAVIAVAKMAEGPQPPSNSMISGCSIQMSDTAEATAKLYELEARVAALDADV